MMETLMSILLLLGGVGAFLAGMSKMSEGLKNSAGNGLKRLFNKIGGNRFMGYGVGIGATAIVQSSSATTIMTVGMANAQIVNTKQGAPIILGAKVGTTLTAFIFALSGISKGAFSMDIIFGAMAFLGVIMLMISKKESTKSIATFLMGFGLLFLGLEVMGMALGDSKSSMNTALAKMFANDFFKNPALLVLIGVLFTFIIQSSTAATAIYIAFLTAQTPMIDTAQAFFLVMGANIGTCSDGLMAAIGGTADGKRLATFHFLTSTVGALVFGTITAIFKNPIINFFDTTIVRPEWSLAIFNLSYNLIYTLILLPVLPQLVVLMAKIIKDGKKATYLEHLNPQLLQNPVVAVSQTRREILEMGKRAQMNLDVAFHALLNRDTSPTETVLEQEEILNSLNREISDYLIQLSSMSISLKSEREIGTCHHVINDIERIGDHAKNFMVLTAEMKDSSEGFTEESIGELVSMYDKVNEALTLGLNIFESKDRRKLSGISALEKEIDTMHKAYSKMHFKHLNQNSNWAEIQIYYDVITELERIGDHVVNIAFSIINPTGDETK